MRPVAASRREYGLALLAGAVGAGLILLAVRQRWAEAVFTAPKPLTPQVVAVSGADLVPLAGALAVAALAGLAAVIATRGVLRQVAGALLALFGAAAGAAVVVAGAAGHAIMTGTPWRAAVLAGALLVFLAGLATVLRGSRWPVMSARYDLPDRRGTAKAGAAGTVAAGAAGRRATVRPADSASMWESLSGGGDPTADPAADPAAGAAVDPERPRTAENR